MLFASVFGAGHFFDMVLVANALPLIVATAVLYISQNFLVPEFHRTAKPITNSEKLTVFLSVFFVGAIFLSVLLYAFGEPVIFQYTKQSAGEEMQLIFRMYQLFVLSLPFVAASSVISAYLNAEFRFAAASIIPYVPNIVVIFCVIAFQPKIGIMAIPVGNFAGYILLALVLFVWTRPSIPMRSVYFEVIRKTPWKAFAGIVFIEFIGQTYILADRYFFKQVPSGGIAAINYASTIFSLPMQIIPFAVSTVLFAKLSREYQLGNLKSIESALQKSTRLMVFIFVPISFVLFIYGDGLISLLFARGKFDQTAVAATFHILRVLIVGFTAYAVYSVLNRVMFSLQLIRQLILLTLFAMIVKITGNILLSRDFSTEGLAAATVIAYFVSLGMSVFFLRKKGLALPMNAQIPEFVLSCINGVVSYFSVHTLIPVGEHGDSYKFIGALLFVLVYIINSSFVSSQSHQLFLERMPFWRKKLPWQ